MNLSVSAITSTSAILSWYPPRITDHNGIITEYTVRLIKEQNLEPVVYTTTNNSLMVASLEPYTQYSYTVSASTSQGQGPFSNFVSFQTNQDGMHACIHCMLL